MPEFPRGKVALCCDNREFVVKIRTAVSDMGLCCVEMTKRNIVCFDKQHNFAFVVVEGLLCQHMLSQISKHAEKMQVAVFAVNNADNGNLLDGSGLHGILPADGAVEEWKTIFKIGLRLHRESSLKEQKKIELAILLCETVAACLSSKVFRIRNATKSFISEPNVSVYGRLKLANNLSSEECLVLHLSICGVCARDMANAMSKTVSSIYYYRKQIRLKLDLHGKRVFLQTAFAGSLRQCAC